MKSALFGSQEENPSPMRQGHPYFFIICLFIYFIIFLFSCEQRVNKVYTIFIRLYAIIDSLFYIL